MSSRSVLLLMVTLIWTVATDSEVCFDKIGCLNMSYPWSSDRRHVPTPLPPEDLPIKLYFFSRENIDAVHILTPFPEVNLHQAPLKPTRPTIIITHDGEDGAWMYYLKDAYLQNIDSNVMVFDWTSESLTFETRQAVANLRVLAKVMILFLKEVSNTIGISPEDVHLIGDGLGAHLMSYIANDFHGIGRITGLDPAREFFQFHDSRVRLDPSDAKFVDVIHTNGRVLLPFGKWGVDPPAGHVDFYPNGGEHQPGCEPVLPLRITPNILQHSREVAEACNHRRAREYFIEAVKTTGNCIFWGHKVEPSEYRRNLFNLYTQGFFAPLTAKICTDFTCIPIGLDTPRYPARGSFMLTTRRSSPYCVWDPSFSLFIYTDPLKEMFVSFRSKFPFLQPWIPEIDDSETVP